VQSYILRYGVIICTAAKLIDICFVLQEDANCVGTSPDGGVQQKSSCRQHATFSDWTHNLLQFSLVGSRFDDWHIMLVIG